MYNYKPYWKPKLADQLYYKNLFNKLKQTYVLSKYMIM